MILNDAASLIFNGREPEVWLGGTPPVKVWPSRNVVDIALGVGFAARDAFRAALTARGLDYTTITEVPFEINLTGTGEATHLFRGCASLTTGPELDTRNVTNMNGMFQDCNNLTSVPPMDTSNVTNAPSMFAYCRSLTSVPTIDAAKITNVSYMFVGCVALTDGNVLLTNKNPNVTTTGMISGSGLTREPWSTATSPVARKVTIRRTSVIGEWDRASATGDTGLIQGWGNAGEVQFQTAVTCDQTVYSSDSPVMQMSGAILRAGALISPHISTSYTFTEVL